MLGWGTQSALLCLLVQCAGLDPRVCLRPNTDKYNVVCCCMLYCCLMLSPLLSVVHVWQRWWWAVVRQVCRGSPEGTVW